MVIIYSTANAILAMLIVLDAHHHLCVKPAYLVYISLMVIVFQVAHLQVLLRLQALALPVLMLIASFVTILTNAVLATIQLYYFWVTV